MVEQFDLASLDTDVEVLIYQSISGLETVVSYVKVQLKHRTSHETKLSDLSSI